MAVQLNSPQTSPKKARSPRPVGVDAHDGDVFFVSFKCKGSTFQVPVMSGVSATTIFDFVREVSDYPLETCKLIFKGKVIRLDDPRTVGEVGLTAGAKLMLMASTAHDVKFIQSSEEEDPVAKMDDDARVKAELQDLLKLGLHVHSKVQVSMSSPNPAEILPRVLLGSGEHAKDLPLLKEFGVTHVLNCAATDVKTGESFYAPCMEYAEFDAKACQGYNFVPLHYLMTQMADRANQAGGKLFVHCYAGDQSAIIAVIIGSEIRK